MGAVAAAEAANHSKPAMAVPMHYGEAVGSQADARQFISLLDKGVMGVELKVK